MSNAVGAVSISFNELFNNGRSLGRRRRDETAEIRGRQRRNVHARQVLFLVRRVHNARAHETSSVVSRRTREHFNGTGDRA
jgi:hypothetical protein